MARELILANDNIYHIFNRGALKQKIFLDASDYARWVDLVHWCLRYDYAYSKYLERIKQAQRLKSDPTKVGQAIAALHRLPQKPIEILAWVLMPNHFHMVVKQIIESGISKFLHRICNAYSHYFNLKHNSSGSVFQGRFKAVWIETEKQFIHVCRYNHINPLAAGLTNKEDLLNYPWSSLRCYLRNIQDPITTKELLMNHFKSSGSLEEFTFALFESKDIATIEGLTLDDDFYWYHKSGKQKRAHSRGR